MRPLIGVTGMPAPRVDGLRRRGVAASEKVLEAVFRAGGDPVVLPPSPTSVGFLLGRLDGVVLPGGADVHPGAYGGHEAHPALLPAERAQDEYEIAVARRAVLAGVPLLAICRGMQVLNVALGGDLVSDIDERDVPHRDGFHDVALDAGCRVAKAMGDTTVTVSSYHHQAVGRLGAGLTVTGRASDGVVEVIEHATAPVLAVQWHPEDNAETATEQQALFDAHVGLTVALTTIS
ncbi:gamma-glutamyl-gamma-aminobutyrate hydrolase family protein [Amycolatopsis sp. H6(2020)]|nr:gamma-glutamyl-gamma-aminobutyrate hydrolase family protein [Amycolatopsis sp. H6(2020)]